MTEARPRWKRIVDFPLVAMLIALALAIGALALGQIIVRGFAPMGREEATVFRSAVVLATLLAAYKLAIVRLGAHPRDDLRRDGAAGELGVGIAIGFALFTLVVAIAALLHVYVIAGPGGTSELLIALLGTAIVPAIVEETLFRGILFRWIEQFAGSWTALLTTSALFGAAHYFNPNATMFASFAIACEAGLLLGGAYMLTRSLWLAIGLHAAWNFTQGAIFDVPVSGLDQHGLVEAKLSGPPLLTGGAFGLEASLIALIVATLAGLWMVRLAVRRGHIVRPWWVRRRLASSQEAVGVDIDRDADLGAPFDPA